MNIGGEEAKSGFAPAQLEDAARAAQAMSHVRVRGLMTIPPRRQRPGHQYPLFSGSPGTLC
ncbi:MAG: hypothetical protein ACLUS6_04745 [Dysosmobacter sp.]